MTPKPMHAIEVAFILVMNFQRSKGGNSFAFVDSAKNYDDASALCRKFGFILARINNENILNEVMQKAQNSEFWIGMRLLDTSYPPHYIYETGEPANYAVWARGEPNDKDTDRCVRIKDGAFKTMKCNRDYSFMCQKIKEELTYLQTTNSTTTTSGPAFYTIPRDTTTYGNDVTTRERPSTSFTYATRKPTNNQTIPLLEKRLEDIRNILTIDKKSLTLTQMRLVCATDNRTSSYSIGMMGSSIIIIVMSMLIIGDVLKVLLWIKENVVYL